MALQVEDIQRLRELNNSLDRAQWQVDGEHTKPVKFNPMEHHLKDYNLLVQRSEWSNNG